MGLIAILIIGFIAGLVARAIMPGTQGMGALATTLLGIAGSFVGGLVSSIVASDGQWFVLRASGIVMSIIGAMIVLALQGVGQRARV